MTSPTTSTAAASNGGKLCMLAPKFGVVSKLNTTAGTLKTALAPARHSGPGLRHHRLAQTGWPFVFTRHEDAGRGLNRPWACCCCQLRWQQQLKPEVHFASSLGLPIQRAN